MRGFEGGSTRVLRGQGGMPEREPTFPADGLPKQHYGASPNHTPHPTLPAAQECTKLTLHRHDHPAGEKAHRTLCFQHGPRGKITLVSPAAVSSFERRDKIIPLTVGGFNKISELKSPPTSRRIEQAMVWTAATCKREVIFHCSGIRGLRFSGSLGLSYSSGCWFFQLAKSLGPL